MSSIFDKDKASLEELMAKATICWGEVIRLARDSEGQSYMVITLPMMQQQEALKASVLQGLQNGQVYESRLTGFSQYGGYVEVNGVTGHIRNSDFSDDHSDIREYLKAGDKVEVKCKEISSEGYIFWEVVSKVRRSKPIEHDFERDTIVLGRMARISNFPNSIGVFVNLKLGIDALCPLPRDIEIEEGARVTMKIETITPGQKPTDPPRIRGHIISAV